MRSCTLLCDSSRLLIYHKSEPRTPVLSESGALGILVRAFPVLQHHRTYLLSYTPRVRDSMCLILTVTHYNLASRPIGLPVSGIDKNSGRDICTCKKLSTPQFILDNSNPGISIPFSRNAKGNMSIRLPHISPT